MSALQTKQNGSEWRTKVQSKQTECCLCFLWCNLWLFLSFGLPPHHPPVMQEVHIALHRLQWVSKQSPLCRSQYHVIRGSFSKCMINTVGYINLQTENKNIIPDKWPLNLCSLVSKNQILDLVHTFLRHNIIMTFLRPIPICTADWGYAHCWIKLVVFQW